MDLLSIILLTMGLLVDVVFIVHDNKKHDLISIVLKTAASLFFVVLAAHNSLFDIDKFVVIALALDCLGDFVLILRNAFVKHKDIIYVIGTLLFVIAHLSLSYYLFLIDGKGFLPGTLAAIIFTLTIGLLLINKLDAPKNFKLMGFVYILVIAQTCGMAVVNYVRFNSLFNLLLMIGSIIFTISDIILIIHKFNKKAPEALQPVYRILYYGSQILIAISLVVH